MRIIPWKPESTLECRNLRTTDLTTFAIQWKHAWFGEDYIPSLQVALGRAFHYGRPNVFIQHLLFVHLYLQFYFLHCLSTKDLTSLLTTKGSSLQV